MRRVFLICAIGGFVGLAALDLRAGRIGVGVASLLLAAANYILLTQ
jgi:hypothetical protein